MAATYWELEEGTGNWELEEGTGSWELEESDGITDPASPSTGHTRRQRFAAAELIRKQPAPTSTTTGRRRRRSR